MGETTPERIKDLQVVESALEATIKLVKFHRAILYSTIEEAMNAAEHLISNEVAPLFAGVKSTYNLECTISGTGVVVAQGSASFSKPDEGASLQQFSYVINGDQPLSSLMPGDSYEGRLIRFAPATDTIVGGDGEKKYRVKPSALISVDKLNCSPLSVGDTPLVDITVDRRAFVSLDGTAEIKLNNLESYRDIKLALADLRANNSDTSVSHLIKTLYEAFIYDESDDAFVELEGAEQFSSLEGWRREEGSDTVVGYLERLLVGRYIQFRGEVIVKNDEDSYSPVGPLEDTVLLAGEVIDIRTDINNDDVYFVVGRQQGAVLYVLARSITKFMF